MSKEKFLFIFIVEVFAFAAGLTFFLLVFNSNYIDDFDEKLQIYVLILLFFGVIVFKIASKLYKDIEYHNISEISLEHDKSYFRDIIKNYSIAELSYIDGFEFNSFNDLIAMLLKLERLKAIKIEHDKIIVLDYSNLKLKESEKYLLNSVKDGNLDELDEYHLETIVKNECIGDGLIKTIPKQSNFIKNLEDAIQVVFILIICIAPCLIVISYFASNTFMIYLAYFIIALIILSCIIIFIKLVISHAKSQVEYKLLDNGKDIYNKLNGLKNYIKNFSNLDTKEKEYLQLWDDYLIYSVMFGLNKQMPSKYIKVLKRNPDIPISENSNKGIYFKP